MMKTPKSGKTKKTTNKNTMYNLESKECVIRYRGKRKLIPITTAEAEEKIAEAKRIPMGYQRITTLDDMQILTDDWVLIIKNK